MSIRKLAKIMRASRLRADDSPYHLGYDCGMKGPNTYNCHFSIFSTPERATEWGRGKLHAQQAKEKG